MEKKIPKHHIRQEICATRPAYREGRIPKAVKVYTINNESKYILIQGVPSVGAAEDLIRLCSSYGQVEEHHALDEYPCDDQYTDVYLVKYKKIQSARFAKRKIDDYSFYGGNLHVCYAPEYETVADTREKLQDRRKIIATKIRHHQRESQSTKCTQQAIHCIDDNTLPGSSSAVKENASNLQSPEPQSYHQQNHCDIDGNTKHHQDSSQTKWSPPRLSANNDSDDISTNTSDGPYSFILPPPPKHLTGNIHPEIKPKYEYSRVPSKHSTLPPNFDGRILQHNYKTEKDPAMTSQSTSVAEAKESVKIKKDYKPQKQTLRFVPRQAVKRKSEDSDYGNSIKTVSSSDEVNKKIRKNAFVLGDQQGPADLPGRRNKQPEITPGASKSYHDTIKTIRSKISQVITDSITLKK